MITAGSWKRGEQQGIEDAKKRPVLIGILHGICVVVALSLPIAWPWRVVAFFVIASAIGFVRMVLWPKLQALLRRKDAEAAARQIIQRVEAKVAADHTAMLAALLEAQDEMVRRAAVLEDIAANGTPEEKQWVAELNANPFMTPEEAQRRDDVPSPSARIERYRAECAAYNAAHAPTARKIDSR